MKIKIASLILIMLVISLASCATQSTVTPNVASVASSREPAPYVIVSGDQLDIKFFYNPELNESVTVRPDGMISLQLVDEVQAAGKTPAELDQLLESLYTRELRKPVITVIVRSFTGQRVYVGGEVNRPSLIDLPTGLTVLQAVFQAGGFKETAQPKETIIIRKGPENRPTPIRVDLVAGMYGNGNGLDFELQPDDIVYIPKSAIAKANQFVNQYIEQLLLFRGISFGFSYRINDNNNN
jgi:polysaccharide export outer membrane protein